MTTIASGLSHQNSSSSLASLNAGARSKREKENVRIRFQAFPYAGENDYTILCSNEFLSLGGGNGRYGLWLDDRLAKGVSGHVPTFLNENLSDDGEKFDVLGVEVWYLGS